MCPTYKTQLLIILSRVPDTSNHIFWGFQIGKICSFILLRLLPSFLFGSEVFPQQPVFESLCLYSSHSLRKVANSVHNKEEVLHFVQPVEAGIYSPRISYKEVSNCP
jgi:hypothetical protein